MKTPGFPRKDLASHLTITFLFLLIIFPGIVNNSPSHAGEVVGRLENPIARTENDSLHIEQLLQMGDQFEHTDFDSAMLFYKQALQKAEATIRKKSKNENTESYYRLKIKSLRYIAFLEKSWGRYDDAIATYQRIMSEVNIDTNPAAHIQAFTSIGNIYYYQSIYPQALKFYNRALEIADPASQKVLIGNILLNLANTYFQIGHYVNSLSYYHEVQQLYPDLHENKNIGIVYLGIGNIHTALGNFDPALEHYNLALSVYDELSDFESLANIHMSIGALHHEFKQVPEAENQYRKALEHATTARNERLMSQLLLNLGILHAERRDYDKAFENYHQALELARNAANLHTQTYILRNMAIAYFRLNQTAKASQFAQQSLEIAKEIQSVGDQALGYRLLSEIKEKQGLVADALHMLRMHKIYNDSLMNIDKQRQLNEMEAMYHAEQQARLIEISSLELQRNQALLRQKNQVITTFVIAFLLAIIIGMVVLRHNNHRIKANRLLMKQENLIAEGKEKIENLICKIHEQDTTILHRNDTLEKLGLQLNNYRSFSADIAQKLFPWQDNFTAAFGKAGFLLSQPLEKQENLFWVHQHDSHAIIAVGQCPMDEVEANLFRILMGATLERLLEGENIYDPTLLAAGLKEKISGFTNMFSADEIANCLSVLSVEKARQKIRFSGDKIPLYLAISRNTSSSMKQKPDYQELQVLKNNPTQKAGKCCELQLKKNDRLFLVLEGTIPEHDAAQNGQSPIAIPLIDKNQHMEFAALPVLLREKLQDLQNKDAVPLMVAAIEL